jgi:hypothetical protein
MYIYYGFLNKPYSSYCNATVPLSLPARYFVCVVCSVIRWCSLTEVLALVVAPNFKPKADGSLHCSITAAELKQCTSTASITARGSTIAGATQYSAC